MFLAGGRAQVQANIVEGRDHGLANDRVRVAVNACAELPDQVKIPVCLLELTVEMVIRPSLLMPILIPDECSFTTLHCKWEGGGVQQRPGVSTRQVGNGDFMLLF